MEMKTVASGWYGLKRWAIYVDPEVFDRLSLDEQQRALDYEFEAVKRDLA